MTPLWKDPDAVVDYTVNWGDGYLEPDETLATSEWLIEPTEQDGLVKDSDSNDPTSTTAFFSGGVRGHVYRVTNRIATSAQRTDDRTIVIRVGQR